MARIVPSNYDTFEEYTKAFREDKLKKKQIQQKKKRAKYYRLRRQKLSNKKKAEKRREERKEERIKEQDKQKMFIKVIKERDFDFLKYRMFVDYYFRRSFFTDINKREFEFLFFLYSEPPFSKQFFVEFSQALTWNRSRLSQLIEKGYIREYLSKEDMLDKRRAVLYDLTKETRKIITNYYKTLLLCYEMPTYGEMFKPTKRNYMDMKFAKMIDLFNERLREYHHEVALNKDDNDRFDLNQHTFKEIYQTIKDII